jgi:hypothetical protein
LLLLLLEIECCNAPAARPACINRPNPPASVESAPVAVARMVSGAS